ncbi:nucleolar protein 14 [Cryptotermes secundus]|uniref:nucleolar protein 14 n=1 Tax=Cryptotermes secundus TaxID=105785 RepID=UPI000CD7C0CA|nr:nucleolar protein 14 [Cryptotermes secundus]
MSKVKNKAKKKRLSERAVKTNVQKKKILNPFEVHVNRQKYDVLGRKTKNGTGIPGVARAKAVAKRKKTLLQEYRVKDKSNRFLDRRIGEKNSAMTTEDKIMARFTAERMKMHSKKSIFNLADDEILTHRGQTLSEIEKFDDPRSDDEEEEEEERGKLGAEFVEDAHFGGGILKKSSSDGHASRKDLIEQLIAESKKRKAEKQRAREQTIELTEKLDTEWKDLLPIVSSSKTSASNVVDDNEKPDSYDTVMRQLKFEARGKPSDRLKSEEELAQEEKERLEKLEMERLQRMHGFKEDFVPERKHRSADDLDDGFEIESEEEVTVSYSAGGELDVRLETNMNLKLEQEDPKQNEEQKDPAEASEESEKSDDDDSEDEDNIDDLSDLKNVSHSDDDGTENEDMVDGNTEAETRQNIEKNHAKSKTGEQRRADLLARKEVMEKARKELPYTFQVPDTYEELHAVLFVQSPGHQAVILERMIKCNHPSLGEGFKVKLANLFGFLLQHLQDTAVSTENEEDCNCFLVLDCIVPHLYDLTHVTPLSVGHCMVEVLKEKQQDFRSHCSSFPGLDTLVFLKLISHLFPTSDFRHPVVTPACVFMCQMLCQCKVKTARDVARGLFLVTLILEYTVLSKRFSPAAINFLHGVLYMGVPKTCARLVSVVYPVHITGRARNLLVLSEPSTVSDNAAQLMNIDDLRKTVPTDDRFKLRALHTAVKLLIEFCCHLENMAASYEILKPLLSTLKQLDMGKYPLYLQKDMKSAMSKIEEMRQKKLQFLVMEKKKPKALRLYEPRIEQVFDGRKRQPMGKVRQEREKLLHKYKREMKGAIREIRRDRSFLAKLKLKHTLQNDMERKQKVKEIFGSAAMQQGELRKLKRKKL